MMGPEMSEKGRPYIKIHIKEDSCSASLFETNNSSSNPPVDGKPLAARPVVLSKRGMRSSSDDASIDLI